MHEEWEKASIRDAYKKLSSDRKGISEGEASKRLKIHGKNEILSAKKTSPFKILFSQFTSPLVIILIAAGMVSFGTGFLPGSESGAIDSILIIVIVLAVGISGFFQDWKAEQAIDALRRMSTTVAIVIRDGKETEIPATEVVIGDVVVLETGNVIPADGKIVESFGMMVDESILTGESVAVRRTAGSLASMNTSVISGRGRLLVFATGMGTSVGKLAEKMEQIEDTKTPFQVELSRFSGKIFWIVAGIAMIIFVAGYFKYGLYNAFLTSVSLAVAAIPEGLPAVVTLALALGAKTMVSNNALIRKLPVVESVGSVNIICTDKTGTLTKNKMSVTQAFFDDSVYAVTGINNNDARRMEEMLKCGILCSDSKTVTTPDGKKTVTGDQTEVAITEFSQSLGYDQEDLRHKYRRISEVSFTSNRKMMSVACKHSGSINVYTKGAPEVVLQKCGRALLGGKVVKLDGKMREKILKQNSIFAAHALRVLAFAYKTSRMPVRESDMEKDLVFLGLEGMLDPPREEVSGAIADCITAGIRVIMITGDNIETAKAISNEIGLESRGAVSGGELSDMDDRKLSSVLDSGVNIFARVDPFDKLRILEMLQKNNRVVMTGDGVNDSLALKKADVGIAMGLRGTDVAKEASDIILLDDNFATIRNTVKEGRRIFDNIRKFVNYLLSCNFAEVFVIFVGTFLAVSTDPILLPVHILWINLLTDGIPALALGADPALPNIMKRKPRDMNEGILDRKTLYTVVAIGLSMGLMLLITFFSILPLGFEIARSSLFMSFVLFEFMRIAVIRHNEELSFFDNRLLILALTVSILMQLAVVYTPLNTYFSLVPLGLYEWVVIMVIAVAGWFSSIGISRVLGRYVK